MKSRLKITNRVAGMLVALCIVATPPLAAQQPAAPPGTASAAPTSTASTPVQSGPRLRPQWQSVEPSIADSSASTSAAAAQGSHTITVTTLVLVLLVILAVLLIA